VNALIVGRDVPPWGPPHNWNGFPPIRKTHGYHPGPPKKVFGQCSPPKNQPIPTEKKFPLQPKPAWGPKTKIFGVYARKGGNPFFTETPRGGPPFPKETPPSNKKAERSPPKKPGSSNVPKMRR